MVQRSLHWDQGATNPHAFTAITLPHLALWPQFLLNCQRSYISVPVWRFLVWGRQRTPMQYSWTPLHDSAHRFRFISQAGQVNTTFAQEGFVRTLLRSLRSSLTATQKFGRGTPFKLPFVGRLHRAQTITHVLLRSYRHTRRIISPNISRPSSMTSSRKRANQLVVNSRKPTRRQLAKIGVATQPPFDPLSPNFPISQFKAGDWLVGLFCLTPIHIAVTGQNRFIPLRDGVISQECEQSLLGADVGRIAEEYVFMPFVIYAVLIYHF